MTASYSTPLPVASVVRGNNAELLREASRLWFDASSDVVLDVTYGRGKWWSHVRPLHLVTHDKFTLDGVDFRRLPEASCSVDVVAFDPPYVSPGGRGTSTVGDFNDRYGLVDVPRTPLETQNMIGKGVRESHRVLRKGGRLLVKCSDYVSSGKFFPGHQLTVLGAVEVGFEQVDEFVHWTGTGPQPKTNLDGTPRRQVHSRRSHSFLCVFRKAAA